MAVTEANQRQEPSLLHRYLSITAWLLRCESSWLPADLLAGVAVWAVTVPQATLGAIVIQAMSGMLNPAYFQRLYRINRSEFLLASAAFLGKLVLGILGGVLLGVIISLLLLIR